MTVFDFSNFRDFIRTRVALQIAGKSGRKKSSVSRIAKELGYATPTVLSMVVHGKRIPSDAMCETMASRWGMSLKEKEYFRLLVQLERQGKAGKDISATLEKIRTVAGKRPVARSLKEFEFSMISDWYYLVIKQLAETSRFQEDPHWISRALRKKITPKQAQQALESMQAMGILRRDPVTHRLTPSDDLMETTHEIPSVAIRLHHKGMIERSLEALEEQSIDERFFTGMTINLDRKRLPEVKRVLLEAMKEIGAEHSKTPADSVFQLNVQFFEHIVDVPASPAGPQILKKEFIHAKP